jgi:hypothetical protein
MVIKPPNQTEMAMSAIAKALVLLLTAMVTKLHALVSEAEMDVHANLYKAWKNGKRM